MRKGKSKGPEIPRAERVEDKTQQAEEQKPAAFGVIGAAADDTSDDKQHTQSASGKHAKEPEVAPAYIRKSRRMRKILIAVLVVLILLLAAGGVLGWQLFQTANMAAEQQLQVAGSIDAIDDGDATRDVTSTTVKNTTVPDLVSLLGLTAEEAVEALQHGAQLTSQYEVNEEGNPIKQEVRIALTAEPSDSISGTPTVYLSMNEEGRAIQTGYSVATSSLGYGSLSFSDAIQNERIIEKTLDEAGLSVEIGSVALPSDRTLYSTYASDGTTLTKENYAFEGIGIANAGEFDWNAILTYDYSTANATGNLADTIRTIYIYVTQPGVIPPEPEEVPAA